MATAIEPEIEVESSIVEPTEHYEVVEGRIVEEPPLGAQEIRLASRLVKAINLFDVPGKLGEVVSEALFVLRKLPRVRRRPDVAFVSSERWPLHKPTPPENAWDVVPDLAVEVISLTDIANDLMAKLEEYFRAGVRLVWVIYPDFRKVYAYESRTKVHILQDRDELEGAGVLPGFRMALANLFETREDGPPIHP